MWEDMSRGMKVTILLIGIVLVLTVGYFLIPDVRTDINQTLYDVQKADDASRYSTRKTVEDTARAMVSSYTADKLMYEQYAGSDNSEKQSWAEQARMRANKTAASYNEYILKNPFVWDGNIPKDILSQLDYIK